MPKSYTDKERETITKELRCAAMESMIKNGVKKTTVDDLVAKARIPKGTFYLFYNSKELLLYDAIMEKEEEMHRQISEKLNQIKSNVTVDSLSILLFDFYKAGIEMGILPMMLNGELDILMRKLPDEIISEHISKDDEFLSVFLQLFPSMQSNRIKYYSAAFRAVFFTAVYQREIGEFYDEALQLLIKGLVLQMWGGKDD